MGCGNTAGAKLWGTAASFPRAGPPAVGRPCPQSGKWGPGTEEICPLSPLLQTTAEDRNMDQIPLPLLGPPSPSHPQPRSPKLCHIGHLHEFRPVHTHSNLSDRFP